MGAEVAAGVGYRCGHWVDRFRWTILSGPVTLVPRRLTTATSRRTFHQAAGHGRAGLSTTSQHRAAQWTLSDCER